MNERNKAKKVKDSPDCLLNQRTRRYSKRSGRFRSKVLNKPQMRLLLKISGGTFYQIQTENSALSQRMDSKPLTDPIYVFEYSIFVPKT